MPADEVLRFLPSASRPAPAPPWRGATVLRFLVVGDIFGQPGRHGAARFIPALRRSTVSISSSPTARTRRVGRGLTRATRRTNSFRAGVDVPHPRQSHLVPAGVIDRPQGRGSRSCGRRTTRRACRAAAFSMSRCRGARVRIVSLMGRVFLHESLDDPFRAADDVLRMTPDDAIVLVDFHAEATSEKVAMGWHLDGRVAAVFGTHTAHPDGGRAHPPAATAVRHGSRQVGPQHSIIGSEVTTGAAPLPDRHAGAHSRWRVDRSPSMPL